MAKLTAWLVTIIGILLCLPLIGVAALDGIAKYVVPIAVLVIGIGKLVRNYKKRPKEEKE